MIKTRSPYLVFFLIAAVITVFLFSLNIFLGPTIGGDSEWYIAAANGHWNNIIEPYSGRFLHPFLVGWLSRHFPLDIYQGFLLMGVASIFLFFVINIIILKDVIGYSFLLLPLFLLPYFFDTLREIFQPDAFYIFLTALFFIFLFSRMKSASLLTLFGLFLARESTMLLGLVYAAISWFRSKKLLMITIISVIVISIYATGVIKNIGQPNVHNLSSSAYVVLKLSYNFLTNVAGVKPWVNISNTCEPVFRLHLPPLKSLGTVQEIGFCGFDFIPPLKALIVLLTIFGIAPLVLFYVLSKKLRYIFKEFSFGIIVALTYGLVHYFIGIIAGTGIQRIVGYSWPAFLIVAPFFIRAFFEIDKKFIVKLSLIQLFTAWLPLIVYRIGGDAIGLVIFIILAVSTAYFYAFRILKNQKMSSLANFEALPILEKTHQ